MILAGAAMDTCTMESVAATAFWCCVC